MRDRSKLPEANELITEADFFKAIDSLTNIKITMIASRMKREHIADPEDSRYFDNDEAIRIISTYINQNEHNPQLSKTLLKVSEEKKRSALTAAVREGFYNIVKPIVEIPWNMYDLALMLDDKNQAQIGKIYLSEEGTYVVRDPRGILQTGSLKKANVDLSNLCNRLNDGELKKRILAVTSEVGYTLSAPVNARDGNGMTPLTQLLVNPISHCPKILELLLTSPDIDIEKIAFTLPVSSSTKLSPLFCAAMNGNVLAVERLIGLGAKTPENIFYFIANHFYVDRKTHEHSDKIYDLFLKKENFAHLDETTFEYKGPRSKIFRKATRRFPSKALTQEIKKLHDAREEKNDAGQESTRLFLKTIKTFGCVTSLKKQREDMHIIRSYVMSHPNESQLRSLLTYKLGEIVALFDKSENEPSEIHVFLIQQIRFISETVSQLVNACDAVRKEKLLKTVDKFSIRNKTDANIRNKTDADIRTTYVPPPPRFYDATTVPVSMRGEETAASSVTHCLNRTPSRFHFLRQPRAERNQVKPAQQAGYDAIAPAWKREMVSSFFPTQPQGVDQQNVTFGKSKDAQENQQLKSSGT